MSDSRTAIMKRISGARVELARLEALQLELQDELRRTYGDGDDLGYAELTELVAYGIAHPGTALPVRQILAGLRNVLGLMNRQRLWRLTKSIVWARHFQQSERGAWLLRDPPLQKPP